MTLGNMTLGMNNNTHLKRCDSVYLKIYTLFETNVISKQKKNIFFSNVISYASNPNFLYQNLWSWYRNKFKFVLLEILNRSTNVKNFLYFGFAVILVTFLGLHNLNIFNFHLITCPWKSQSVTLNSFYRDDSIKFGSSSMRDLHLLIMKLKTQIPKGSVEYEMILS